MIPQLFDNHPLFYLFSKLLSLYPCGLWTLSNFDAKVDNKLFQFGGIFKFYFYFNIDQNIMMTRRSHVRFYKIKIKKQPDIKLCMVITEIS